MKEFWIKEFKSLLHACPQFRTRSVQTPSQFGGSACDVELTQERPCHPATLCKLPPVECRDQFQCDNGAQMVLFLIHKLKEPKLSVLFLSLTSCHNASTQDAASTPHWPATGKTTVEITLTRETAADSKLCVPRRRDRPLGLTWLGMGELRSKVTALRAFHVPPPGTFCLDMFTLTFFQERCCSSAALTKAEAQDMKQQQDVNVLHYLNMNDILWKLSPQVDIIHAVRKLFLCPEILM